MENISGKVKRLKNGMKFKSIYKKLLFSYIIIISFILFISALMLFQGYKKQVLSQSNITSEKLLNQAEYYYEYNFYWAKSYLYQLYLNNDVYDLMFSPNNNIDKVSKGIKKISQASEELPSVQSIYVYNGQTNMIYPSFGSPSHYTEFFDKDIKNIIAESKNTISTNFIPRCIEVEINGTKYTKNILTIFLTNVKNKESDMPYGAIMLNIDASDIQDYYRSIAEDDYNIFAIDNSGRIILNSNPSLFLEDISDEDYVTKILDNNNEKGSFLSTVDGKYSIIFYKSSERLGLKFVNIIPYNKLLVSMNEMLKSIICTSIILFLAGVLVAFFYSRGILSPIDRTVKNVKRYIASSGAYEISLDSVEPNENEIDYLSKIINEIITKPISLKKLPGQDLNFIKRQLMIGLLYNSYARIDDFASKLKELQISMDLNNIMVVLFKIDSYREITNSYKEEELEEIKGRICMQASKIMAEYYDNEYVVLNDELCLIISIGQKSSGTVLESLIKIIENIQDKIVDTWNISLSAALGDYVYHIEDASESFKTARQFMNYRLKYGQKSILYRDKIMKDIYSDDYKYMDDIEDKIFKGLKTGNIGKVKTELDNMFEQISHLSYNDMIMAIVELEKNSKKLIDNINNMNKTNINFKQITSSLDDIETLDNVKCCFMDIYEEVIEQNKMRNSDEKRKIIETIKEYINNNYFNNRLSVETIADNVKLSPNYIRVLFKNMEGKSLSNYVNEIRFQKARDLLESTDLTVMEISDKVGFGNYNYFYTAFKKFYGISPNKYRNNIKR